MKSASDPRIDKLWLLLSMKELIIEIGRHSEWKLLFFSLWELPAIEIAYFFYDPAFFYCFGVLESSSWPLMMPSFVLFVFWFLFLTCNVVAKWVDGGSSTVLLKCFLYCSFKFTSRIVGYFVLLLFFDFKTGVVYPSDIPCCACPCNFFS